MGENESPHDLFNQKAVRKNNFSWRPPIEDGTRISATAVSRGLVVSVIKRVNFDSGITNLTSRRIFFAREFQTKPKQNLSQKIYPRTAQPARLPGELTIAPSFDVHLFCSLNYWGVGT
jgi:hypothetical protein